MRDLKTFLKLRDNSPVFDECRAKGSAGIPCFVREDGSITLVPEEVGLKSRPVTPPAAPACSPDGKSC